jgi:Flp pilus assembly protein TadB
MENENFSKEESFNLIAKMITRAKNENRDKGEGWLLWGWLLIVASIASAVLKYVDQTQYLPWLWNGIGIIVLIYFIYGITRKKSAKVKTYVEEMLDKASVAFFLSLITMIIATAIKEQGFAFGYYFILYAFWMYIYGSVIQFKPLLIGAFVNWAAAILIFIVDDFFYGMIISAIAVLIGYLIPGYMLRSQYNKSHKAGHGV